VGLLFFWLLLSFIIFQRVIELLIARRNEQWMKAQGAIEVGEKHYKYIVLLHVIFFLSFIIEVLVYEKELASWWFIPFTFFVVAQVLRIWALISLGSYWNTKVIILPGAKVVAKGPYRFLRHPNYLIVIVELLMIPLIFEAYFTSLLFTFLNAYMLSIRIPIEEKALQEITNYGEVFAKKARFLP
jgi:methyltransferase